MIIITAYHGRGDDPASERRRGYLRNTIRSVDAQSISALLHIIVDDGSTDGSCEEIKKHDAGLTPRVYLRREKQPGEDLSSTLARNFALAYCEEEKLISATGSAASRYVTFIDADDLVVSLGERLKAARQQHAAFVHSDCLIFFDDVERVYFWNGEAANPRRLRNRMWVWASMPYPTMTWRADFLLSLKAYVKKQYGVDGPFDPTIGCGEDVDIALSSLEHLSATFTMAYVPMVTAAYRIHDSSLAAVRDGRTRRFEEESVLIRHFGPWQTKLMHVRRFLVRPECYVPSLWGLKNSLRRQTRKSDYNFLKK
jgi:hypothetical protein